MKRITFAVTCFILLAFGFNVTPAQEPKPSLATVTLTDLITGMSRIDEKKVEYRLNGPKGKGGLLTAPQVLVDENKIKVNLFGKKALAFQGQVSIKEVIVGMTNSIPPGKITAKGLYLTASEATEITDDNKAKFPSPGMAQVQGKGIKGTFATSKTSKTLYAIENGEQPILLLGKDGAPLEDAEITGTILASGQLRIGDNGALILEVAKYKQVEEKK